MYISLLSFPTSIWVKSQICVKKIDNICSLPCLHWGNKQRNYNREDES